MSNDLRPALFERHVIRVPFCTCHLWIGGVNNLGYGVFHMRGKRIGAHRAALIFAKGEPPFARAQANHECDIPSCVNPDHLYWGTQKQNIRDMVARGRVYRKGESCNGPRKLTAAQALAIRQAPGTLREVAALHLISPSTVSDIRRGYSWSHV